MGGFALVLLLAGFATRGYRQKQKANKALEEKNATIEKQKEEVTQKNIEITKSIEYALRIQTAILPPQKIIKQNFENSFVLYQPKDIVAGDFYWMETIQCDDVPMNQLDNEENSNTLNALAHQLILFAACDCTGHGVPGALVSVVCHNALNRAVREFGLRKPADILDKTNEIVKENFSKSEEEIKDGMDISLCNYNPQTKILQWAGANNALWLLINGEITEIKADKQPIGRYEGNQPFTNYEFKLNAGDSIYIFSDGYADQFGGDTGHKKLTKKRFRDLILSIQSSSMKEQGEELSKFMHSYMGSNQQIDDILVVGVQV